MPLGPEAAKASAEALADAVTDAMRPLWHAAHGALTSSVFDAGRAAQAVSDAAQVARRNVREAVRVETLGFAALAWHTGAAAVLDDAAAAGVNITGLSGPVDALAQYLHGDATFNEAMRDFPEVKAAISEATISLMEDLDGAAHAAAGAFGHDVADVCNIAQAAGGVAGAASNWNQIVSRGFVVPVATGRRVRLDASARATTAAHLTRLALTGFWETGAAAGIKYCVVSRSAAHCPLCDRWEGRILARTRGALAGALRSADPLVQAMTHTIDNAVAAGLFHPGCRHTVTAWVENASQVPAEPDVPAPSENSHARAVRDAETNIAAWDRRAAFGLTSGDRGRAQMYATQWRFELAARRPAALAPAPAVPRNDTSNGPVLVRPADLLASSSEALQRRDVTAALHREAAAFANGVERNRELNPHGRFFSVKRLNPSPGHTLLTLEVSTRRSRIGDLLFAIEGPPRQQAVTVSIAAIIGDEQRVLRDIGDTILAAWSPAANNADPYQVTNDFLAPWPGDLDALEIASWVNNSRGVNRSWEVEFATGDKGIVKPVSGDYTQRGVRPGQFDASRSGSLREVCAADVDRALGLDLVPATEWWDTSPEGPASIQRWAAPVLPALAAREYPPIGRQRMFVLDTTIGEFDRHMLNYLTHTNGFPIAIDHGHAMTRAKLTDEAIVTAAAKWWPIGTPLDPDEHQRLLDVDAGALWNRLANRGLPDEEIDPMAARFESIRLEGGVIDLDQFR